MQAYNLGLRFKYASLHVSKMKELLPCRALGRSRHRGQHGQAPPRSDHVPEAARDRDRPAVREVRWEVCDLRLICEAVHARPGLRRVQLRVVPGAVRHLRGRGDI